LSKCGGKKKENRKDDITFAQTEIAVTLYGHVLRMNK
jgi:hypothetical protein